MKNINYHNLLERALKMVVKEALAFARVNGLGDGAHFFLTFKTGARGVEIPDFLRARYPETMMIVLQWSYSNLNVSDDEFGVTLTFDGRPYYIRVPFSALVEFKDPSADFILQFQPGANQNTKTNLELPLEEYKEENPRIVSLDEYRKKKSG